MPSPIEDRLHVTIGRDLIAELEAMAEREQEGNVSRMMRELIREGAARRKAPRRGPAAAARAR